jgi:hypothetical protein
LGYNRKNIMKQINFLLGLGIILTSSIGYGQFTDQINSNRPGESMGAYSLGKNVLQAEAGVFGINESFKRLDYTATGFGTDLAFRAGLLREQLEFIIEARFQYDQYSTSLFQENRSGLRRTLLGAKYLIYDPFKKGPEKPNIYSWKANHKFKWSQFIPAFSIYVGGNYVMDNAFSIPEESTFSPKAMLITQNHFKGNWVIVTNLFYDKFGSTAANFGYVFTITNGFHEKWSIFFENKGIKSDYYSDGILTFGATHLLKNNIQIDASISKNIKTTPSFLYGGIGMSWRFDKKHKDIQIKDGKEVKGKKPKEVGSKRLDDIEGGKIKEEKE